MKKLLRQKLKKLLKKLLRQKPKRWLKKLLRQKLMKKNWKMTLRKWS